MIERAILPAAVLALLVAAPAHGWAQPRSSGPVLKDQPTAPSKNLELVRVGGGLDQGAIEYFDETSVTHAGDKASVWRLFVMPSPRSIGRMMTQAVWVLTDFDCKAATVEGKSSSILGMGLELLAHGSPRLGDTLLAGEAAEAITASEVCDGRMAPGDRFTSVSAAVRDARSTKPQTP